MKKYLVGLMTLTLISVVGFSAFAAGTDEGSGMKEDVTIAGIIIQNDIYMRSVQIGMKETGEKMGVEVLMGNSDNKVDKEAQLIDTYISRGVKAIVIQPLSFQGSVAALNRARDKGIKIILMGTKSDMEYDAFLASENYDLGKASGEYAKDFIEKNMAGESINIATVSFVSQYPEAAKQRTSGFTDIVAAMPNAGIVAQQDAWLAEMAIRVVGDMLTANPEINIIHAANEGGTVGAVQAVKNAGREGKVFVFGTDGSDQIIQLLESSDNILQESTGQQPYVIGQKGVMFALDLINGKPVEKETVVPVRPLKRGDQKELNAFKEEMKKLQ